MGASLFLVCESAEEELDMMMFEGEIISVM